MAIKYKHSYSKTNLDEDKLDFRTIPELLYHHATVSPNKAAFVFLSTESEREVITWKEVFNKSQQVARSLMQIGVKQRDIVAISYRNCPEWLYTEFGVIMANAVPVSLSFTYEDGHDVIAMMELLENCSTILLDPGINDATWDILKKIIDKFDKEGNVCSSQMPSLRHLVCLFKPEKVDEKEILTFNELISQANDSTPLPETNIDDIMGLFQTSGSTGVPKVVAHTHRFYTYCGQTVQHIELGPDEISFNDRPFSWLGGFPYNIYHGETRVTRSGMSEAKESRTVDDLRNVIMQERCTNIMLFPAAIEELCQKEIPDDWPIISLITGGQPTSRKTAYCLDKGLCKQFLVCYGSSETLCMGHIVTKSENFIEHSVGKPFPGIEVKIVDKDGEIVPVYTRGELYVRTKAMFVGYYNDPEKTREVLTEDGWYRTDDIAYMTDDGLFFVEGRKSDMIISGGLNVAPSILEAVLKNCPGVKDAMIVPIPHDTLYQVICACVIPQPGSSVTQHNVRKYCEDVHADKQHLFTVLPTYYLLFDDFPQSTTGKSSRKLLIPQAVGRIKNSC